MSRNYLCGNKSGFTLSALLRPGFKTLLAFFLVSVVAITPGCGGGKSKSSSGGGTEVLKPAPLTTAVVGPNLNGTTWAGRYASDKGNFETLTATVRHEGNRVTIETTKQSGIARSFSGTIKSSGHMTMLDSFNNQTWTTLYEPASGASIILADFVVTKNGLADTNNLFLKRGN